jgi:hypothetical protein
VLSRQSKASAEIRAALKSRIFSYGPSADETFDVFGSGAGDMPIHLHILAGD